MQDEFDVSGLPQEKIKKMKLNKNTLTFLGIGLVILIVLGFFGFQYVAPFGAKVSYQFNQQQDKDKISALKGAESSNSIQNNASNTLTIPEQVIRRNIVTFNLKLLSKKIDGVWVNLKFKGDPKELKIGVKGELKGKYTYQPLCQQFLESIKAQTFSDLLFWQKNKNYKDFLEFAKNPPFGKIIAVYNFDPTEIFSYIPANVTQGQFMLNKLLRGTHEMLVKVDNAPLTIDVKKQDQNAYKGADALSIEVYKENKLIIKKEIPDDGIIEASSLRLQPQQAKIEIKDISPGIYRVLLLDKSKGAEIIISSIKINQKNAVFNSPVFIIDDKQTSLFTNSLAVNARAAHLQGLQTLRIDDKIDLKIDTLGKTYIYDLQNQKQLDFYPKPTVVNLLAKTVVHKLAMPKSDLIIKGDGVFAFDKNSLFNPDPLNSIDISSITDISSIDYVIARYQEVQRDGDWNIAKVYFDSKDITVDGDKLYFSLESPGLSQSGGEIAISSLEVTVNKPGWLDKNEQKVISNKQTGNEQKTKSEGFLNKITNFFKNLWPFGKKEEVKPTLTPEPTNTPTPIPTLKEKLKISIQNGGGIAGIAGKYADLLKKEGFKNVESGNSPSDIKNASISYNKAQEGELESTLSQIETILNNDYGTVNKTTTADKDKINIILGALSKPTPTASPSAR